MKSRITTVGLLMVTGLCLADPKESHVGSLEWEQFGVSNLDGKTMVNFYESTDIVRKSAKSVRVWTRVYSLDSLASVGKEVDAARMARVKSKVEAGYVPPIVSIESRAYSADTIFMDDVVNTSDVQPIFRELIEINCEDLVERELSRRLVEGNVTSEKPTEWAHIEPGTPMAALQKLVCSSKT